VKNGHFWRFFLVLYAITAIMNVVVGFVDENYAHSLIWCVVLFLSIPLVWHECAPKADPERKMIENACDHAMITITREHDGELVTKDLLYLLQIEATRHVKTYLAERGYFAEIAFFHLRPVPDRKKYPWSIDIRIRVRKIPKG
jgi:hypothetical protein